ncbi:hypothetical protein BD626DRAFT_573008 [Schizophyllum amplum]|uniref:BIR-domain-containing protein n=1 Tax=Schizophyllum amplum TaxID=97359 RepID=A0A550C2E6_9AGAR|nr:hypothetical protein BD626DRAFT_573008 [Auriculariopsis ampla]
MECLALREASFAKGKRVKNPNKPSSTVLAKWPHKSKHIATPHTLAEAGFFYDPAYDERDNVSCFMCSKSLSQWEEDDDPFDIHWQKCGTDRRCPWAVVRCGLTQDMDRNGQYTYPDKTRIPTTPMMVQARLLTFSQGKGWPHSGKDHGASSQRMAEGGFIYNPQDPGDDGALCVYCGTALSGWDSDDDPLQEHYKRGLKLDSPCSFLQLKRSADASHKPPSRKASSSQLSKSQSRQPSRSSARPASRQTSRSTSQYVDLVESTKEYDGTDDEDDDSPAAETPKGKGKSKGRNGEADNPLRKSTRSRTKSVAPKPEDNAPTGRKASRTTRGKSVAPVENDEDDAPNLRRSTRSRPPSRLGTEESEQDTQPRGRTRGNSAAPSDTEDTASTNKSKGKGKSKAKGRVPSVAPSMRTIDEDESAKAKDEPLAKSTARHLEGSEDDEAPTRAKPPAKKGARATAKRAMSEEESDAPAKPTKPKSKGKSKAAAPPPPSTTDDELALEDEDDTMQVPEPSLNKSTRKKFKPPSDEPAPTKGQRAGKSKPAPKSLKSAVQRSEAEESAPAEDDYVRPPPFKPLSRQVSKSKKKPPVLRESPQESSEPVMDSAPESIPTPEADYGGEAENNEDDMDVDDVAPLPKGQKPRSTASLDVRSTSLDTRSTSLDARSTDLDAVNSKAAKKPARASKAAPRRPTTNGRGKTSRVVEISSDDDVMMDDARKEETLQRTASLQERALQRRVEEEARLRAEEEARLRAEEEARLRAEQEARQRAQEAEEDARREEAALREEEARRAEELARQEEEEETQRREEEARRGEQEARRAEQEARRREAEERRRREAQRREEERIEEERKEEERREDQRKEEERLKKEERRRAKEAKAKQEEAKRRAAEEKKQEAARRAQEEKKQQAARRAQEEKDRAEEAERRRAAEAEERRQADEDKMDMSFDDGPHDDHKRESSPPRQNGHGHDVFGDDVANPFSSAAPALSVSPPPTSAAQTGDSILPPLTSIPDEELDMTVEEWIRAQMDIAAEQIRHEGEAQIRAFVERSREVGEQIRGTLRV